jgi:hypothetical protein
MVMIADAFVIGCLHYTGGLATDSRPPHPQGTSCSDESRA